MPIFQANVVLLEEVEARWAGPLANRFLDFIDWVRADPVLLAKVTRAPAVLTSPFISKAK